ncbi:MAG: arylsulfatase [Candidatus Hydrogenedentes bacterium]|nr:arylsulfatase [Candidatus Hydrogenedentota bacterium]
MSALQSRRRFLGTIGALAVATQCPTQAASTSRPNIIFILADDLGYGDLGCYGQTKIKTPNIDALAAQGTRFTQCYAGAAVCAPSRSVLMTGQHVGHTRIRGNSAKVAIPRHDGEANRVPLYAEDFTVAQLLKGAGYATGIAGKWGLGEPGSTGLPNDHGFDEWLGYLNQNHAPDYFTDYLWRNKEKQIIPGNLDGKRQTYSCDLFADFAIDFIRAHKEGPFFLYLPFTIPHKKTEVPDLAPYANESWSDEEKTFAAMITRLDGYVGRISQLLKELNIDDNTIVFFASDNGAPETCRDFFARSGILRDIKGTLYDGGIRVPMIVRWPGKVAAGKSDAMPWYFADFLPTAGAIAGAATASNIDGANVLPIIFGNSQPEFASRFLYWETPADGDLRQAARKGPWKAVRQGLDKPIELYNLDEDVWESKNVAAKFPQIVNEFRTYFAEQHIESPHWPVDPEKLATLKSASVP